MSWDAYLIATDLPDLDGEHCVRDWNYTHNCNGMANTVLRQLMPGTLEAGARRWWHDRPDVLAEIDAENGRLGSWWMCLNGQTGKESVAFLDVIIGGLMEAPAMFKAMNPENGWGDYDSFLAVLVDMRDRAGEFPSAKWRTSG